MGFSCSLSELSLCDVLRTYNRHCKTIAYKYNICQLIVLFIQVPWVNTTPSTFQDLVNIPWDQYYVQFGYFQLIMNDQPWLSRLFVYFIRSILIQLGKANIPNVSIVVSLGRIGMKRLFSIIAVFVIYYYYILICRNPHLILRQVYFKHLCIRNALFSTFVTNVFQDNVLK